VIGGTIAHKGNRIEAVAAGGMTGAISFAQEAR